MSPNLEREGINYNGCEIVVALTKESPVVTWDIKVIGCVCELDCVPPHHCRVTIRQVEVPTIAATT